MNHDLFVEHTGKDFDMEKKVLHGDGVIIGTGTMYSQPVCIYAQDFTVAGGSLGLIACPQDHQNYGSCIEDACSDHWYQRFGWCAYSGRC